MAELPLPPGKTGLPLIGQTLTFLKDGLGFVDRGIAAHGPIFKTSLLGRKAAVICGPDATQLFNDDARVMRQGGMPANIETLFAGRVLPVLDGDAHRERKHFVLAAFQAEALESYVPRIRARAKKTLAACAARGEGPLLSDLKDFTLAVILELMIGLDEGPIQAQMKRDYEAIIEGLVALPLPLPGTAYSKAKKALARALATLRQAVTEHRLSPRDDGLSRILAARSPRDGHAIGDEEAAGELHHVVIAGFIVWCWLVAVFKELAQRPELLQAMRAEAAALSPEAGLSDIEASPLLRRAAMEVQRHVPVLPILFGKAKTDIEFQGHRIPSGWMLLWAWHATHRRPEIYADPTGFDPARFDAPRSEHLKHPCGFAPNGYGDVTRTHKCVGYELAPLMLEVFTLELLRSYEITVPPQDWSHDPAKLPPAPRSGVVVRLSSARNSPIGAPAASA
jgi:cytochrome P450